MRRIYGHLGLLTILALSLSACEAPGPVAGGDTDGETSDGTCTPGFASCECVEGQCFGGLSCDDGVCTCVPGALGCPCVGDECLGNNVCVANVCTDPNGDGDGDPTGDGDGDPTGDGDGDPTGDGDGDPSGDGDGDPTGDGDGDPSGDGDGDPTGDGDGEPLPETCQTATGMAGCEFYFTRYFHYTNNPQQPPESVLFLNPHPLEAAEVQIQIKSNGEWAPAAFPIVVMPGDAVLYEYNNNSLSGRSGIRVGGSLRAISDLPVEVLQFSPSITVNSIAGGGSMTHLLPVSAWGHRYRVLGWAQGFKPASTSGSYIVTVTAAVDNTTLTVFPPVALALGPGFNGAPAGGSFQVQLDAGDNFGAMVTADDASLAGMLIQSDPDHPFSVLSSHMAAEVGSEPGRDRVFEQNLPIKLWGTEYVALRPPHNFGFPPAPSHWQIVADTPNTVVDFSYTGDLTGVPNGPIAIPAGGVLQFAVNGIDNIGDFSITANHPVGVMSFMPHMDNISGAAAVVIPPADRLRSSYIVYRPDAVANINWMLGVGAEAGMDVYFDAMVVPPTSQTQLDVGWSALRFIPPNGPFVVSGDLPFVATMGGWGNVSYERGYGYLAGMRTN